MQPLSRAHNSKLTEESKEHWKLLHREGIRRDFFIVYNTCYDSCAVEGNNIAWMPPPTITMWPGLKVADKDAYNFLLKRQFYYLKNHFHERHVEVGVGFACAGITYYATKSIFLSIIVGWVAAYILGEFLNHSSCDYADDFAIQNCTVKELEGGLRYFLSIKKIIFINAKTRGLDEASAEKMSDFSESSYSYTSLKKRIEKLSSEIKTKGGTIPSDSKREIVNCIQRELNERDTNFKHLG